MSTVKAGNIQKGMYIEFKSKPHVVTKSEFYSPGKGSAFARVKMKSLATGSNVEFNFKSNEQVPVLDVNSQELQFLYKNSEAVFFMDPHSYEQFEVGLDILDGKEKFLTPDARVYILFFEEKPMGVNLPPKVKLKVTQSDDAVAGDTVNAAKKPVVMETGLEVMAPLFIKEGETLVIDTATGQYVSRAN
jgi:elongation factor P